MREIRWNYRPSAKSLAQETIRVHPMVDGSNANSIRVMLGLKILRQVGVKVIEVFATVTIGMDNNEGSLESSGTSSCRTLSESSSPYSLRRKYGTHNCTIAGTIKIDLPYRSARLLSGRKLRLKDRAADPPRPCPEFSVSGKTCKGSNRGAIGAAGRLLGRTNHKSRRDLLQAWKFGRRLGKRQCDTMVP
ncbi:hypothetical protein WN48_08272 [Eufriesea mexicana]|nr:hypothetical protein WN48_08272 [Eufriesea mexicana]